MGGSHASILRPIKRMFFYLFLFLHHQNNRLESTYNFYLPLLNSLPKVFSGVEKIFQWHLHHLAAPKLRMWHAWCIEERRYQQT